ncbi:dual specificity protein phosphatase MPK-4-like isoform X2 [Varroa jacobsoni]|uniref:protein-tyrosine-phosphatase n=1 Tax=Varroa destructor TaxID=109461 RepID=A0A7M7JPE4_VARDE|nr:dual specificity protein phosphatase MPK-4-like isoform X2 [Varroa destructor]XP_022685753.1 dual specificity protein phosphatase MPK-4-like isoform X2 [Varroa jacobsoni]
MDIGANQPVSGKGVSARQLSGYDNPLIVIDSLEDLPASEEVDTAGLNCSVVAPNIFVSDRATAENEGALVRLGITHIVTVDSHRLRAELYTEPKRFQFHFIRADDVVEQDLLTHLPEMFQFLDNAGRILFHCHQGISRSVTLCIAYLMLKTMKSLEDISKQICQARPQAFPNNGFWTQLLLFERMGNKIDRHDLGFQMYALKECLGKLLATRCSQSLTLAERENFYQFLPESEYNIRCKKCGYRISSTSRVIPHQPLDRIRWSRGLIFDRDEKRVPGLIEARQSQRVARMFYQKPSYFAQIKAKMVKEHREVMLRPNEPHPASTERCKRTIFIIPDEQILSQVYKSLDRINCPKCHRCLGRYNWNGLFCECGGEYDAGFILTRSSIDQPSGW